MKNQDLSFLLSHFCPSSVFEWFGSCEWAHRNKKESRICTFFTKISKSSKDERLKFEQLAIVDILEITHDLDHDLGPHMNQ